MQPDLIVGILVVVLAWRTQQLSSFYTGCVVYILMKVVFWQEMPHHFHGGVQFMLGLVLGYLVWGLGSEFWSKLKTTYQK